MFMTATVLDTKVGASQVSIGDIPERLATGGFPWLDIDGASADDLRAVASALPYWLPAPSTLEIASDCASRNVARQFDGSASGRDTRCMFAPIIERLRQA